MPENNLLQQQREEAASPETISTRLTELAKEKDKEILKKVVSNPNTPPEILAKLGQSYPSQLIKNPIFALLPLENPNFFRQLPEKNLEALLKQKTCPEWLIELVFKQFSHINIIKIILINQKQTWNQLREKYPEFHNNWNQHSFKGINLSGCNFNKCSFINTDFSKADLRATDLQETNLTGANFSGANLTSANLSHAILEGVIFDNFTQIEAKWIMVREIITTIPLLRKLITQSGLKIDAICNFQNQDLSNAYLRNIDLSYANLSYANLRNSDLSYTDLSYANLQFADLRKANLTNTNLTNANMANIKK